MGALHCRFKVRRLMMQSPLRPPTMKAALSTPGQMATASALSKRSRGTARSGTDMILRKTSDASFEWRAASAARLRTGALFLCAVATEAAHNTADATSKNATASFIDLIKTPLLDSSTGAHSRPAYQIYLKSVHKNVGVAE